MRRGARPGSALAGWALLVCAAGVTAGCRAGDDRAGPSTSRGVGVGAGGGTAAGGGAGGDEPTCTAAQAATAADRALIGQAAPYPADGTLRGRTAELAASPLARREVAWRAVERALTPVPIAGPLPEAPGSTLPMWQTWYGKDDLRRLFHHLYQGIGPERRQGRAPFEDAELDGALAWNPLAVEEDPAWPADRRAAYAASLDEAAEVAALGGIGRASYSPGATRHVLRSYGAILGCDGAAPPPAVADAPTAGPRRMAHHAASLTACERRTWGPYFVGDGEDLIAAVEGPAQLELIDEAGTSLCAGEVGETCRAEGPRAVHVVATARRDGEVAVDIDYAEADPAWASCLAGQFPIDAAVVKADWRRVWPDDPLPTFDTSQAALATRLANGASWDTPDGTADPGPDAIYTVTTPVGSTFRLAGLHLMTKELDHWLWISLWWSPTPDDGFGADRPASLGSAPGPWRNYAMCVVTSFDEPDGSPTWCSNPYIERGAGNAASNCIGCHQHGGTGLTSEGILADMPAHGTTAIRNNFPGDYAWALDSGDLLLRMIADEVAWWDEGPAP